MIYPFSWLLLAAASFLVLWRIAIWLFKPRYESLNSQNVHRWVDILRAQGIEVIEEPPEFNPFKK
jgi:hypothetical protein